MLVTPTGRKASAPLLKNANPFSKPQIHLILWEYQVNWEHRAEFEKAYSANGVWAELFRKAAGFLETELAYDETNPGRYLTIDRWETREAYELFLSQWKEEYQALDMQCEHLTESESYLGGYEVNFV